jgi:hypothetical protein
VRERPGGNHERRRGREDREQPASRPTRVRVL